MFSHRRQKNITIDSDKQGLMHNMMRLPVELLAEITQTAYELDVCSLPS